MVHLLHKKEATMYKLLSIIFIISFTKAYSQELPKQEFHHQLGGSASSFSGMGLSYHYIFSDNYRIKLTGFYLNEGPNYSNSADDIYLSTGIEGQKTLFRSEATRFYALAGIGFFQQASYNYPPGYGFSSYSSQENTYSGGVGVGIELIAVGRVSFNFDAGITYSFNERKHYTDDGTTPPVSPQYRSEVGFGLGGGLGFGYQF